jgi:hypothetical protein
MLRSSSPSRASRSLRMLFLAAVVLAASATSVRAGFITATFNGVSPGDTVTFKLNGGNSVSTSAGEFNWTYVSGTPLGTGSTFKTFCIDLTHFITPGHTYTYNLDDPTSPNADAQVFSGGLGAAKAAMLSDLFGQYYGNIQDNHTAAAFQIAVWDIVYDGGVPTSSSPFQVISTGTAETMALSWLNNLDPQSPGLMVLDSTSLNQNQITFAPPVVVPEPSTFVLGLIAGAGIFGAALRRRKLAT